MEPSHVLRAARRRSGLDQRSFAAAVGVPTGTWASWESGRRRPAASALDAALAAVGLDLALVPRLQPGDSAALRRHLHLSLTQRLRLALGESPALSCPARTPAWLELGWLARRGQVVVEGQLARALWLPLGGVTRPAVSLFHARVDSPARGHVDVRVRGGAAPRPAVPFMMETGERLWVLPPGELALPDELDAQLRRADELLHAYAPLDDAARRRPAHRDPDEPDEDRRMLRTKGVRDRPDMRDGRGWRLGAPASLAQQLRQQ
jgi:transcriptional regulator with XRE-family HTH domain